MSDFKIIETQEQLDAIMGDRLRRQAKSFEEKFANYLSPDDVNTKVEGLNTQIADLQSSLEAEKTKNGTFESTISELNEKVKKYETDSIKRRIATEMNLPVELATRISGETEDEMRTDAESLKNIFGKTVTVPLAKAEPGTQTTKEAEYLKMLHDLKK